MRFSIFGVTLSLFEPAQDVPARAPKAPVRIPPVSQNDWRLALSVLADTPETLYSATAVFGVTGALMSMSALILPMPPPACLWVSLAVAAASLVVTVVAWLMAPDKVGRVVVSGDILARALALPDSIQKETVAVAFNWGRPVKTRRTRHGVARELARNEAFIAAVEYLAARDLPATRAALAHRDDTVLYVIKTAVARASSAALAGAAVPAKPALANAAAS